MTLITGIICKDGVVIAADSQQTNGNWKRLDINKITVIQFANTYAIVAEAGCADYSGQAIEILKRKAKDLEVMDFQTVENAVCQAVHEVLSSLKNLWSDAKVEWLDTFSRYKEQWRFELLIAHCWNEKPCLFKVGLETPVVQPTKTFFHTAGIGSDLAVYLLKEYATKDMDSEFASALAIYVTEKANDAQDGCMGPIRLGVLKLVPRNLYPENEPLIAFPIIPTLEEVSEIGTIIRGLEHESRTERERLLREQLSERTRKQMEIMLNPRHPSEDWTLLPPPKD
jgi:hypothetical protein